MSCPLCGCSKYFTLNHYDIEELKDKWLKFFDVDPFNTDISYTEIRKLQCLECQIIYYNPMVCANNTLYEYMSSTYDWYYEKDKWEFDVALESVLNYKPNTLLEFGCGEGLFLEKILSCVDCSGVEINQNAIKICEKKGIHIEKHSLKEITRKYDMIVSFEVFEHLENIEGIIIDLIGLLNVNGILLIAVPNPNSFLSELDMVLLDMPPHHNIGFNENCFHYIADKFNLTLQSYLKEPLRYLHYQWYMNEIFYNQSLNVPRQKGLLKSVKRIFKKKRFSNIKALRSLIEPYNYFNAKESIEGQTHLAIFQKQ